MSALEDMKAVIELAAAIGSMKADVERLTSELAEARTERAKLHDMLIIAEGQRDQAKMRAEKAERLVFEERTNRAFAVRAVEAERDALRKVDDALIQAIERVSPLVDAAKELNTSYHDVYAVNRVRKAYQQIEDTWEDVRARCS